MKKRDLARKANSLVEKAKQLWLKFAQSDKKVHLPKIQLGKFQLSKFHLPKAEFLVSKLDMAHLKSNIIKIPRWTKQPLRWIRQHLKTMPWRSPKFISGAAVAVLVIGGATIYLNGTSTAAYIYVNGEKVGIVSSESEGQQLVDITLAKHATHQEQTIKTHDQITYQSIRIKKSELLQAAFTEKKLEQTLTYYAEGYELKVGDTQLAVLANQADADKLLKEYQDYYAKPGDTNKVDSVQFEETVSKNVIETTPDNILTIADAFKKLVTGQIVKTQYVVQKDDSWWLIARKNDMKTAEVLAGNPGTTEDSVLKPGQKIAIVKSVPFLNVVSKGVSTTAEVIPFDVQKKTDNSLASGKTVVKQAGADGQKVVTTSYLRLNGKTIGSEVLDEKITKQPVVQVVAEGPAPINIASSYTASRGSGTIGGFIWPAYSHYINSYYGYRNSGFHTGIDISGDQGDPIMAAAAGTIVSSGWNGNYGYSILIDHGNGVMTRYAHASKLSVSAGQYVSQGQVIGLIGATGNTTGPHLHFEVIINGSTTNPLNYLP